MPVKLLVTRTSDESSRDEYVFDRDSISIGRDTSNHLTLPDLKRVVSKHHAELRHEQGVVRIVDLGSKNFTYVNDERLQSSRPREIGAADVIRIGEFEIRMEIELTPEPNFDGTVFDVSFVNPFADDVGRLAQALRSIQDAFDREAPSRREDALRDALQEAFGAERAISSDEHTTNAIIANQLAPAGGGPESPRDSASSAAAPRDPAPPVSAAPRESAAPAAARQVVPESRLDALVDVLLGAVAKLVNIPWQFRHEFVGQTIVQADESAAMYSGDADAMRQFLLDARMPDDESARRREVLADAAEQVALHQLAMMDGYKAGAQQGTQRLLDEFDPAEVEATARREGGLGRYIPILARIQALGRLKQKMQELKDQDWSVAERRIFRPAFIKAYLARMTSLRK